MTGDEKTFGTYADQRRSAEDLLHAFRARDADAIERVRQRLPHVQHLTREALLDFPLTLSGAQTVIALALQFGATFRLHLRMRSRIYSET